MVHGALLDGKNPPCNSRTIMEDAELYTTAELAYIALTPDELSRLKSEVSSMVAFFEKMKELDVTGLQPTTHALARGNRTRNDNAPVNNPSNNDNNGSMSDAILEQAPDLEDRFICIPNVL